MLCAQCKALRWPGKDSPTQKHKNRYSACSKNGISFALCYRCWATIACCVYTNHLSSSSESSLLSFCANTMAVAPATFRNTDNGEKKEKYLCFPKPQVRFLLQYDAVSYTDVFRIRIYLPKTKNNRTSSADTHRVLSTKYCHQITQASNDRLPFLISTFRGFMMA